MNSQICGFKHLKVCICNNIERDSYCGIIKIQYDKPKNTFSYRSNCIWSLNYFLLKNGFLMENNEYFA